MEITFLGTGTSQGVPVVSCPCTVCASSNSKDKRLRSSILLKIGGKNILIDAGPDFRQQLLREHIDHLDAILITHEHKDHIGGLDDIRALNYTSGRPIDIYAEERVLKAIRYDYHYAFVPKPYPGVPEMNLHKIDESPFKIDDILITPIRVMHYRLPILGYRINNFTYITDGNYIEKNEFCKISNSSVLVLNTLRKEEHLSHFTLAEGLDLAKQAKAKTTYFTHISHQMGLHNEVSLELPKGVYLAYDGLKVNIF